MTYRRTLQPLPREGLRDRVIYLHKAGDLDDQWTHYTYTFVGEREGYLGGSGVIRKYGFLCE